MGGPPGLIASWLLASVPASPGRLPADYYLSDGVEFLARCRMTGSASTTRPQSARISPLILRTLMDLASERASEAKIFACFARTATVWVP